jgi:hypothetical protein
MATTKLTPREVHDALNRVNWDFPGATTLESTVHSLHRFPGNFIPQIPSYLIQILSNQGDLVFDPFCGSGTTGIEAAILGRRVWHTDANRVSILVTEGKIAALSDSTLRKDLTRLVQEFFWILPNYRTQRAEQLRGGVNTELSKWFHPDTLAQLHTIWRLISSTTGAGTRALLEMLFSDTLFACASTGQALTSGGKPRRHHWGWIADNVRPNRLHWHNAERLFHERLVRAFKIVLTQPKLTKIDAKIQRQDIRRLSVKKPVVDLVVTSPPYLGMIDYALANRLTYLWFDWPMDQDRELEIGARFRRNRAAADAEYLDSIDIAAKNISALLKGKGYCAVVIGASRKFPGMAEKVVDQFGQYLTPISPPIKRSPSRRRVSDRKGSEFQELVCVFRK